ncbi:hypothetical protein DL93DRAFT_2226049 [Clavulina sp. PMI_390]|nr:hypothetical protein DL93DRAFT_2226049 [Clavulina sp. PMI_390]
MINPRDKYKSLPDIDPAQEIYETPDVLTSNYDKDVPSDDELLHARPTRRVRISGDNDEDEDEEIDNSSLPDTRDVGARWRKAEKRRNQFRNFYSYPPSDGSRSRSPSPDFTSFRKLPPKARLQRLMEELQELDQEVAKESAQTPDDDPESLLQGVSDLKERIMVLSTAPEMARNSHKLLSRAVGTASKPASGEHTNGNGATTNGAGSSKASEAATEGTPADQDAETMASLDRRLGEIELIIGASNATLDESSPLPQPLLPHINRLSNILTLLTQPRQIDAVSRRLKLLQTDLERYSASQTRRQQQASGPTSGSGGATGGGASSSSGAAVAPTTAGPHLSSSEIALILQRLAPALPTIPHLLTRLRTLSSLHASASGFASELATLEEQQRKSRASLDELSRALDGLEASLDANAQTVAGNLQGLQTRLEDVQNRLVNSER